MGCVRSWTAFKAQLEEAKKRFEATFHAAPESREAMREQEKKRVLAANRLAQVESEIAACVKRPCHSASPANCLTGSGVESRPSASQPAAKRLRRTHPLWRSESFAWSRSRNRSTPRNCPTNAWRSWNGVFSGC